MNKTVKKVFLLIGLLVLIFLIWQLVFNKGGIVRTVYDAMVDGINDQWHKVAGSERNLLPKWGKDNAVDETNGKGFEMNTGANGVA